jgi:hypothetical protein
MTANESIVLRDIDPEDLSDVVTKIGKSFDLAFDAHTFEGAKTVGDICAIVSNQINLEHSPDCTSQQAFYKIRQSIATVMSLEKNAIVPDSNLEMLFPRKGRRHRILRVRKESGLSLDLLEGDQRLAIILLLGLIGSSIELLFNWKYGLLWFGLISVCLHLSQRLGKNFRVKTVGEVATMVARENYIKSRRNPKTVNRQEVVEKIRELFAHDLSLEPSSLLLTTSRSNRL